MGDYILRATAANGMIRAFVITGREMVEYARVRHQSSPVVTAGLGRLLMAGAMMGIMMKGEKDLMTLEVRGDGPVGGLTVTADAHGNVKGYAEEPLAILPAKVPGKLNVGGIVGQGDLIVIKDLGLKEPYVSQIPLVSGEIAEDLTYYFANSEQVPSSVALGVLLSLDNIVTQAGGFILQLMPGIDDETVSRLEEKLSAVAPVTTLMEQGMTPEDILYEILGGFAPEILERIPAQFYCGCSKEHFAKKLITLGRKELEGIVSDNEPVTVRCHFCSAEYTYSPEEMKELLRSAGI